MKRYQLTNNHWNCIAHFFFRKQQESEAGPKRLIVLCSTVCYGPPKAQYSGVNCQSSMVLGSLCTRFFLWRDDGTFRRIFLALSQDTDMENLSIDSTCVKVHESGNSGKTGNKAVGRTKGGLNIKIHVVVDGFGNPVEYLLSASHDNNSVQLLKKVNLEGSTVLEERAYGTEKI